MTAAARLAPIGAKVSDSRQSHNPFDRPEQGPRGHLPVLAGELVDLIGPQLGETVIDGHSGPAVTPAWSPSGSEPKVP